MTAPSKEMPPRELLHQGHVYIRRDIALRHEAELQHLRTALTGISTCSTCEACRGAALRALGESAPKPGQCTPVFDRAGRCGTCTACGKNFTCGARLGEITAAVDERLDRVERELEHARADYHHELAKQQWRCPLHGLLSSEVVCRQCLALSEATVARCEHGNPIDPTGGYVCLKCFREPSAVLPFTHWSKDPLCPYDGCYCSSCNGARNFTAHVSDSSAQPPRDGQ